MATSIYDVQPGDYVQVTKTREYKRIRQIDPEIDRREPLHYRRWTITTEDGARLTMYDVHRYFTKAEYEGLSRN